MLAMLAGSQCVKTLINKIIGISEFIQCLNFTLCFRLNLLCASYSAVT